MFVLRYANSRAKIRAANLFTYTNFAPLPAHIYSLARHLDSSVALLSTRRTDGFAGFALNKLFTILDTLTLVRFGRPEHADFRRSFTQDLAISPGKSNNDLPLSARSPWGTEPDGWSIPAHVNFLLDLGAITAP